jgi:hypothetical protein
MFDAILHLWSSFLASEPSILKDVTDIDPLSGELNPNPVYGFLF